MFIAQSRGFVWQSKAAHGCKKHQSATKPLQAVRPHPLHILWAPLQLRPELLHLLLVATARLALAERRQHRGQQRACPQWLLELLQDIFGAGLRHELRGVRVAHGLFSRLSEPLELLLSICRFLPDGGMDRIRKLVIKITVDADERRRTL